MRLEVRVCWWFGMVEVRGRGMYCGYECPHKDRQDIFVEHVRETVVVLASGGKRSRRDPNASLCELTPGWFTA